MTELIRDLRYGLRLLAKTPIFTAATITWIAVSVAATVTVFSALNAIVFRPLPVPRPEELIRIVETRPNLPTESLLPYAFVQALQARSSSFYDVLASTTINAAFSEGTV